MLPVVEFQSSDIAPLEIFQSAGLVVSMVMAPARARPLRLRESRSTLKDNYSSWNLPAG